MFKALGVGQASVGSPGSSSQHGTRNTRGELVIFSVFTAFHSSRHARFSLLQHL